jgi:hypothetical protein
MKESRLAQLVERVTSNVILKVTKRNDEVSRSSRLMGILLLALFPHQFKIFEPQWAN